MVFKDTFLNNKGILTGKYVRISGQPGKILGGGGKALKMGFNMPSGFSTKREFTSGFIDWNNVTPELRNEILNHIPKSAGQQTLL